MLSCFMEAMGGGLAGQRLANTQLLQGFRWLSSVSRSRSSTPLSPNRQAAYNAL